MTTYSDATTTNVTDSLVTVSSTCASHSSPRPRCCRQSPRRRRQRRSRRSSSRSPSSAPLHQRPGHACAGQEADREDVDNVTFAELPGSSRYGGGDRRAYERGNMTERDLTRADVVPRQRGAPVVEPR